MSTAVVGTGVRLSANGDWWDSIYQGEIDAISPSAGATVAFADDDATAAGSTTLTSANTSYEVVGSDGLRERTRLTNPSGTQVVYVCCATGATGVTVGVASTPVVTANPARKRITLTNDSDAIMCIALGPTAGFGLGIVLWPYGGRWVSRMYQGPISAITFWVYDSVKNLCVQEET